MKVCKNCFYHSHGVCLRDLTPVGSLYTCSGFSSSSLFSSSGYLPVKKKLEEDFIKEVIVKILERWLKNGISTGIEIEAEKKEEGIKISVKNLIRLLKFIFEHKVEKRKILTGLARLEYSSQNPLVREGKNFLVY